MRNYELVLIISPEAGDNSVSTAVDRVQQFIEERGGQVLQVDNWGKRKLAYPIARFQEGDYVVAQFRLDPPHIRELESSLHLSEEVIRHLVVKLDK